MISVAPVPPIACRHLARSECRPRIVSAAWHVRAAEVALESRGHGTSCRGDGATTDLDPHGGHAAVALDIATRVASQLAGAAPVLNEVDRETLYTMRTRAEKKRQDWNGWPTEATYIRELALLDRLLGASR